MSKRKKRSCKKKCPFFRAFGYCEKDIGEECDYKKVRKENDCEN